MFHALFEVMRAQKQVLFTRLAAMDAHPGQAFVLRTLVRREGLSQADLAQMLGVSQPTVAVMLRKMEHAGLVCRETDEDDRRITRLSLTDAGKTLAAQIKELHAAVAKESLGALPDEDLAELERLLGIVNRSIRDAQESQ